MQNRVPTDYIVTRRQKRYIAKQHMKDAGIKQFNKHSYTTYTTKTGYVVSTKNPSRFAEEWRDYIHVKEEA